MPGRETLDDKAAGRISRIAALLESPVDGEALAAGRALVAALDRHGGLRIADVILAALAPESDRPERWWREIAFECLEREPWGGWWPQRTRRFLEAVTRMLREPSPAQQRWLSDCDELVRDTRAAS